MKKHLLFTIVAFLAFTVVQAQPNTWTIRLNKKTLLKTSQELPEKNIVHVKNADWKNSSKLEIRYQETDKDTWYRSFLFRDENDNELFRTDSASTVKLQVASLREKFGKAKVIRIYTTVTPKDPNLAVRVRPVHLCTLRLP